MNVRKITQKKKQQKCIKVDVIYENQLCLTQGHNSSALKASKKKTKKKNKTII